jgi:DNA-binding transcriptional LysR family regulator
MDTLVSMKVFRQVVDSGSFVAAAERLDMSTAMASKHVMHLERRLSARLLNRSSRHLSLTDAGTVYYDQCRELLDNLEETEAAVGHAAVAPRGVLKVTAPVWFGNARFTRLLADYRVRYPDVTLDMNLNDRIVDLVEEGFDVALRVTAKPSPALFARRLMSMRFALVAAPAYLADHDRPQVPRDLTTHATIGYAYSPSGDQWEFEGPRGGVSVRIVPAMRSNNTMLTYQMVLAGMGVSALPPWLIHDDVQAGRLVTLLPDYALPAAALYAVYTSRRFLAPKLRTFVDFLAERCANAPEECTNDPPRPAQKTRKIAAVATR